MTVRWNSRAAIAALAPAVNKGVLEIAGLVEAKAAELEAAADHLPTLDAAE